MKDMELNSSHEADPTDLHVGISIRQLTKVYAVSFSTLFLSLFGAICVFP